MADIKKFLDQAGVSTLWSRVAEEVAAEATRAQAAELANANAAKKAQDDVEALSDKVGTVTEGKTVVEMIDDAQRAATYNDTQIKADIKANADAIDVLNGSGEGSVSKQVSDAVASIVADAPEAYDTLKEISDWISSHASDASAMNSHINTNKDDIAELTALVGTLPETATSSTVVGYIDEAIAALKIGDYAKAADLTAAINRIAELESKSHTHANKALLDTYDQTNEDLKDAVAKKHEHANKEELDKIADGDKAKWDSAAGKAHEHANKDVLDGIIAQKVAAWDAAEQNAKNYADGEINSKVIALTTEEINAAIRSASAPVTTA